MIAWFLRNPVAANLLMVVILIAGVVSALQLREETFPQVAPNQITISVAYDSGSARQAEENIAIRIEQALENLTGVRDIETKATRTGVTITVRKTSGASLEQLLVEIKARVDTVNGLPHAAERPVVSAARWDETALRVHFHGDVARTTLQSLAAQLRDELLGQPAIRSVHLQGYLDPEITIEVDESRLQKHGLSLRAISDVVTRESVVEVSGVLRNAENITQLTADAPRYDKSDFADIVLRKSAEGSELRLGDVAEISDGHASTTRSWQRYNRQPSVGLRVSVDRQGDVVKVVQQARAVIDAWRSNGRLPKGVGLSAWDDRSLAIEARLGTLLLNAAAGIALVLLLLSLLLELRVAFWVAIGLPICFAGALIAMGDAFLGFSINQVSTFGFLVAMGILVDDAIVVGESIHAEQVKSPTFDATLAGVRRVAMPTLVGALTTMVAFSSLALIEGEFGQIFAQFALVVAACLLFSMIESKLILPAHLLPATAKKPVSPGRSTAVRFQSAFERFKKDTFLPLLERAIDYRYTTLAVLAAIWILALGLLTRGDVRAVFFPEIPVNSAYIEIAMQPDAGFGATERALGRVEQAAYRTAAALQEQYGLRESPLISVRTHQSDDLTGSVFIELREGSDQPITGPEFSDTWREQIGYPEGVKHRYIDDTAARPRALEIHVIAATLDEAEAAGRSLLERLENTTGIYEIRHPLDNRTAQIRLELKPLGRALGLTTQDLARQLQQAFYGFETQRIQRGRDEVKVRVRYPVAARQSQGDLWAMRIRTADGHSVPLESVARAVHEQVIVERVRKQGRPAVTITAEVDKGITSPQAVVSDLKANFLTVLGASHPGAALEFGGEAKEVDEVNASLKNVVILAFVMIYTLLAIVLKRYLAPLVIMAVIPFGVAGAFVGHLLHDLPFSILSLFGIMALSGVVINDSLLLVARYVDLRPGLPDTRAALLAAAGERVRAIFLTSVTTYVGLIPLMANPSMQAAFLKPAAAGLAYGVLFSTVITLVLIPVLIMIGEDLRSRLALFSSSENMLKSTN